MTQFVAPRNVHAEAHRYTATILVIEDDPDVAEFFVRMLAAARFAVTVANSGSEGIVAAQRRSFLAILLDMRLPDLDGLDVLRTLRATQPNAHIVVISGHLTVRSTVEAIQLGASNVLEKPVGGDQLVAAVTALATATPASAMQDNHSVAYRWAAYIIKGSAATDDSKTLDTWARRAGTSTTMICESCRILDVKPHDARDLARALYAMLRSAQLRCPPAVLLDVADSRTLRTFQRRAGPGFRSARDMNSVNLFLDLQSFVNPQSHGIVVLRQLLGKLLSEEVA